MSKIYVLRGDPFAMARPRWGRGHVYDPQAEMKLLATISLKQQHGDTKPLEGPLSLDVTFYLSVAERTGKSKKLLLDQQPACKLPDLDNLLKTVGDCAQYAGIYRNDLQICVIRAKKIYTLGEARTEFIIDELKNGKKD